MARIRTIKPEYWKPVQEPWGFARETLYVVQEGDTGPIKIGIAAHPFRRLQNLQCGNYRKLHMRIVYEGTSASCQAVERHALKYFREYRLAGEWLSAELFEVQKYLESFLVEGEE